MNAAMHRDEAIKRLASIELSQLSADERAEQLDCMLHEAWNLESVDASVREEFEERALRFPPSDRRYDPVLLVWLRARYAPVTSAHIAERLGLAPRDIIGSPARLEPCPCCGYRTLGARSDYEICPICWWEDDGQDDRDADIVVGGPNYELSLTQARANFLRAGIANPRREDLRRYQDPASMYEKGRTFVLSADGTSVREKK